MPGTMVHRQSINYPIRVLERNDVELIQGIPIPEGTELWIGIGGYDAGFPVAICSGFLWFISVYVVFKFTFHIKPSPQ